MLRHCVVDENTSIGDNVKIVNKEGILEADHAKTGEQGGGLRGANLGGWVGRSVGRSVGPRMAHSALGGVGQAPGAGVGGGWAGWVRGEHPLCSACPSPWPCPPPPAAAANKMKYILSAAVLSAAGYMIQDGIVVVMRNAIIPAGTVI